jgi:hypothetical protein
MSRETLLDPLHPPCVIWRHYRDLHTQKSKKVSRDLVSPLCHVYEICLVIYDFDFSRDVIENGCQFSSCEGSRHRALPEVQVLQHGQAGTLRRILHEKFSRRITGTDCLRRFGKFTQTRIHWDPSFRTTNSDVTLLTVLGKKYG